MCKRSVEQSPAATGSAALGGWRKIGLLGVAIAATGALAFGAEEVLKKNEQTKLGKEIAAYFEAKDEAKGIEQAFVDLIGSIEKTEKKLKGRNALSLVGDWEKAFFNARVASLDGKLKVRKGRVGTGEVTAANGAKVSFAAFQPKAYRENKGPYPLILILPGAGSETDATLEAEWEDATMRESTLLFAVKMPENVADWALLNGADGQMGGVAMVMSLYGEVLKQFAVDMNRVYLAGSGEGIPAAMATAAAFPHIFAGVIARGETPELPAPHNFRSLPTLFVGGGEGASAFSTSIADLGYENATLLDEGGSSEVWSWIGEHTREAYPQTVIFTPTTPYTTKAHWIGVDGIDIDSAPRVEATVDREQNTVTIQAERIGSIQVFFNDVLVDMDRPVTIIINGESNPVEVGRNRRTMLDLVYNFGDWGRIFTNVLTFDIAAKD